MALGSLLDLGLTLFQTDPHYQKSRYFNQQKESIFSFKILFSFFDREKCISRESGRQREREKVAPH